MMRNTEHTDATQTTATINVQALGFVERAIRDEAIDRLTLRIEESKGTQGDEFRSLQRMIREYAGIVTPIATLPDGREALEVAPENYYAARALLDMYFRGRHAQAAA